MSPFEPKNETEWEELLSAYLDGELEAGERRAVEDCLARHPERAARLEELRRLGGLLGAWTIEAPEPDPAFLKRLEKNRGAGSRPAYAEQAGSLRSPQGWLEALFRALRPAWAAGAAIFVAGVLAGAGGHIFFMQRAGQDPKPVFVASAPHPAPAQTPVMSAGRAATLSRELQAAELRDRLMRDLQRRDYESAARNYQNLWGNYRDSAAVRQLKQNPALRAAAEQLEAEGRI